MSILPFLQQRREFTPTEMLPFIRSPAAEQEIKLQRLDIQVVVTGLHAQTSQTMTFYNPNGRDLAGELHFPLPGNASVCGYALDIDGKMIDGVILPKEEARKILETEIRKGADPGLVEQIQGNSYRSRIYPIPAKGSRTIRLSYLSDLVIDGNEAAYHLPLSHAGGVDKVSLRVEVVQSPVRPEIGGFGNLTLNKWQDRWLAEADLDPSSPAEDLLIRLPKLPDQIVSVEQNKGKTFFNISTRLQATHKEAWQPKRIGIAWDASGSRQNHGQDIQQSLKKDFQLLDALAKTWGPVPCDLLIFRNEVEREIRSFASFRELINHLAAIPYDGGTDLTVLDFALFDPEVEGYLLFSDGLASGDKGLPGTCNKPLITVNSSTHCNTSFLDHVAEQANGVSVNLIHMDVEQAVTAISQVTHKTQISMARGCSDLFSSTDNGRLSILGRVDGATAEIHLLAPDATQILIEISAAQASHSNTLSRAWAGCKARELALVDDHSAEIVALGREYGLVTPGTSLLVLESLDQYLQYNIVPPSSLPNLQRQFKEQKSRQQTDAEEARRTQLEQVAWWWKERLQWWQTDFKADYRKKELVPGKAYAQPRNSGDENVLFSFECESENPSSAEVPVSGHSPDFATEEIPEYESGAGTSADEHPHAAKATITIQAWTPDTSYLNEMRAAAGGGLYKVYLQQRKNYAGSPSFFLDCADYLFKKGQTALAVRVLSNLEELQLGNIALLRIYGWRLQQAGQLNQAIKIFERIRRIRDDEPQSHRDLALALSDRWQQEHNQDDASRAMHLFYEVITRSWDRFPEIELIALMELNRLIHFARAEGVAVPERIDKRFIRNLDLDIRISMSWDTDLTDVDLHVFEPDRGHAYYGNHETRIGGLVSKDFTQGYGPEEYILHNAMPGKYIIKAHYYGSRQQTLCGPCTITATVFTNYGRKNEHKEVLTLRLEEASNQELVGEICIDGPSWDTAKPDSQTKERVKKIRELEIGMSLDEVKAVLGTPDAIRGDRTIVLTYSFAEQSSVELDFGPGLKAVRQVMEGAILELI
ncbi:MAG: DUF2135 domain-containing protein [Proteobacteria bacterium]|nr:DUF2135 domain-containing protein [Pseudomonadota bacterium]